MIRPMRPDYTIALYYKYVHIKDPQALATSQRLLCERLGLTGRIIIAEEGINGTCEGLNDAVKEYCNELKKDPRFADVHFKLSEGTGAAFGRLSIKVRSEIVSTHLGEDNVDPRKETGTYLRPDELKKWYENGEDFVVVDMRNDFEFASGHFENSVPSGMKYFRDLAKVPENISTLKVKKVLTVCTGGVRCEKASAYLLKKGFKDVYQLDGGIVSYMEKYPNQEFKGSLYVFDNRMVMDFDKKALEIGEKPQHEIVGRCVVCATPSERYVNCENDDCHIHYILCATCGANGSFCTEECKKKVVAMQSIK